MNRIALLAALSALSLALTSEVRVDASPLSRRALDAQLRSCIGEAGPGSPDDCVAMAGVHLRRAGGDWNALEAVARRYSAALRRPRRAWLVGLDVDARSRPAGFRGSWGAFREHARKTRAALVSWSLGEYADPCAGESPIHYGGPRVDARAVAGLEARGFVVASCSEGMRQVYLRRESFRR